MKAALRMLLTTGRNSSSSTTFLFLISISPPFFIPVFFSNLSYSTATLPRYLLLPASPLPLLFAYPIFPAHPAHSFSSATAVSMPVLISNCSAPCTYIHVYMYIYIIYISFLFLPINSQVLMPLHQ